MFPVADRGLRRAAARESIDTRICPAKCEVPAVAALSAGHYSYCAVDTYVARAEWVRAGYKLQATKQLDNLKGRLALSAHGTQHAPRPCTLRAVGPTRPETRAPAAFCVLLAGCRQNGDTGHVNVSEGQGGL